MLQKMTDKLSMLGMGTFVFVMTHMPAMAQEGANVRGALETNQQAMEAVRDSTFTGEGVQSAAQSTLNAVLYAVGAIGVIMAGFGIWNLYKHYSEGEQSRGSATSGILMIAIGGMMTIVAIVAAIFPNLFVGTGA